MEFKTHPLYTGYEVNRLGIVNGPKKQGVGSTRSDGYCYVWITSIKAWRYLHRLVWETFNGSIPEGVEVNHKDGNKANCTLDNLELVTHKENIVHSFEVLKRHVPSGTLHYNYGKTLAPSTRQLMSDKKTGVNHPKFKGWYVVDGLEFTSSIDAGIYMNVSQKTILRWCAKKQHSCYFKPRL